MFDEAYVINLNRRSDRLAACEDAWYKLNFYPKRFPAIENENPAAGCYLSHLEILKRARDANSNVLIFEDDIEIINFEGNLIERIMDELCDLDWCLWYGAGNILKPFYQVTDHLARLNHCQSTVFYGVNKKYLSFIIDIIEKNHTFIDVIFAEGVIPQLPCFISIPMIGIQRTDYSDIEKRIMTYDIPLERYNKFLIKKEFKPK